MIRIAYCIMKLRPALDVHFHCLHDERRPRQSGLSVLNLAKYFWYSRSDPDPSNCQVIEKYLDFDIPPAPKRRKWHDNMSHESPYHRGLLAYRIVAR